jgi:hypothetical protein
MFSAMLFRRGRGFVLFLGGVVVTVFGGWNCFTLHRNAGLKKLPDKQLDNL